MHTFNLETNTGPKTLPFQFWKGEQLRSSRECPLSFDCETELIKDGRHIPRLALLVASDGKNHVIVAPGHLAAFLRTHAGSHFVGHHVAFDFWVMDSALKHSGDHETRKIWWDICHQGRLYDTQILDMLIQLGTLQFRKVKGLAGSNPGGQTKIYPGSLAEVAADYLSIRLDKADPYRLRFGELLGQTPEQLETAEPGFFSYALADAVATQRLYPALAQAAYQLMQQAGWRSKATKYAIRPDALQRFGYLGESIQVKASIALAHLLRRGIAIDLAQAESLKMRYRQELQTLIEALQRDYPEVLSTKRDGGLALKPKSQAPSFEHKKLDAMLNRVVKELSENGHDFSPPVSKGKQKGISRSAKEWSVYADRHPFLELWSRLGKLEKLLAFLEDINSQRLHGEYALLMRTGRTSCAKPRDPNLPGLNIQQMPRLGEFRALFVPDAGHRFFIGDFAAAELRTLAAVCRARFGFSRLAEVLAEGEDPHAYTAALLQKMEPDAFKALKTSDPARYKAERQRAKAINFGVPGGMGAESLRAYAQANYGVTLDEEEAKSLRHALIRDIYPELSDQTGYLADPSMASLAVNLGVKECEAWEVLDPSGKRNPFHVRGMIKVVRGESTASEFYQRQVWEGLQRLLNTVASPHPEILSAVKSRKGSLRLYDLLVRQTAVTLTGRLRAGVGYTDSKNTPFQSLCADGAKLALWNLLYHGFDVVAFIHDEILVQLAPDNSEPNGQQIESIMCRAMEEVMGQDVPAAVDWVLADGWVKP